MPPVIIRAGSLESSEFLIVLPPERQRGDLAPGPLTGRSGRRSCPAGRLSATRGTRYGKIEIGVRRERHDRPDGLSQGRRLGIAFADSPPVSRGRCRNRLPRNRRRCGHQRAHSDQLLTPPLGEHQQAVRAVERPRRKSARGRGAPRRGCIRGARSKPVGRPYAHRSDPNVSNAARPRARWRAPPRPRTTSLDSTSCAWNNGPRGGDAVCEYASARRPSPPCLMRVGRTDCLFDRLMLR